MPGLDDVAVIDDPLEITVTQFEHFWNLLDLPMLPPVPRTTEEFPYAAGLNLRIDLSASGTFSAFEADERAALVAVVLEDLLLAVTTEGLCVGQFGMLGMQTRVLGCSRIEHEGFFVQPAFDEVLHALSRRISEVLVVENLESEILEWNYSLGKTDKFVDGCALLR